ncbi:MAG: hypothetical protein SCH66_13675 [Methanolobus sp.]|nr:hypothetical protein [Methanolobus sp.]
MRIDIIRGYEILPNNDVMFGIRITNNDESVISDVQVILDYNESLFSLQGDRIDKLGNIPPTIPRTAKFILKPRGCVHKENIEATISYRDHKWEKHIVTMRPKEVHCVCPFLRARPMTKSEFLYLTEKGHSIEAGINFQGISAEQITSFLMQTCATRLYIVDGYPIVEGKVLYFSSESIGEQAYYLLTALIKENEGLTQVMLRAVSDKTYGIHGFLNEIISELKHLVTTVNSAKEIGVIRNEQVINIIDSVVQRSNIANSSDSSSINIQDSVVQRTEMHTSRPITQNNDNIAVQTRRDPENGNVDEEEVISNMYNTYLQEVRAKRAQTKSMKMQESDILSQIQSRSKKKAYSERGSLYTSLRKDETEVKKKIYSRNLIIGLTLIAVVFSTSFWILPLIESNPINENMLSIDSHIVESKVTGFLNAVNKGDTDAAFEMYRGKDFLAPAAIDLVFSNKGIPRGSIQDIDVISKEVLVGQAVVGTNCNVSDVDITGAENGISTIPIYFGLENAGNGWIITKVSFFTPLTIEYYDDSVENLPALEETTNKLAVKTLSSSLMVKNIEGVRAKNSVTDMSGTIDLLKLKVGLNVGSAPVNVKQVVVSITDGTTANTLVYAGNDASGYVMKGFSTSFASQNLRQLLTEDDNPERYYTVEKIRDEDASFSQSNPVMNAGDLITVYIATTSTEAASQRYTTVGAASVSNLKSSELNIVPRTTVNIVFTPESSAATTADFVTPSAYGVRETVQLYP